MSTDNEFELVPRRGNVLVTGIVARISGCANQKDLSLEDQEDHGREISQQMWDGPTEFRVIATAGKGERLDRPELVQIEEELRSGDLDLLIIEDLGRLVRGAEAVRLLGIGVDHGVRSISPNDCIDTIEDDWEESKQQIDLTAATFDAARERVMGLIEKR